MEKITDAQMELLFKNYEGLYWTISNKIGLDPILHHSEDCIQDMKILSFHVLKSFTKKYPDLTIEEILELEHFNKYLKTVLWNYKNSTGIKISRRRNIMKSHSIDIIPTGSNQEFNSEDNCLFDLASKSYTPNYFDLNEFTSNMGEIAADTVKELVSSYEDNPGLLPVIKDVLKKHQVNENKAPDMIYAIVCEVERALGDA